jgi:dihydrofolate reductase
MSRTQFYTATSLDGFIATPENSLEWLMSRQRDMAGPMNYGEFIADVGALAMGSTTYQWILDYEFKGGDLSAGKWPYDLPCWVFTHRDLPVVPGADIRFVGGAVVPVHELMLKAAEGRNVWIVGGGLLAGQFADAGLLDEVIVMIAPVTLGAGALLMPTHVELKLEELSLNGEFACARFSVVRDVA